MPPPAMQAALSMLVTSVAANTTISSISARAIQARSWVTGVESSTGETSRNSRALRWLSTNEG